MLLVSGKNKSSCLRLVNRIGRGDYSDVKDSLGYEKLDLNQLSGYAGHLDTPEKWDIALEEMRKYDMRCLTFTNLTLLYFYAQQMASCFNFTKKLKEIVFKSCKIDDDSLTIFMREIAPHLTHLFFQHVSLSGSSASIISQYLNQSGLKVLSIEGSSVYRCGPSIKQVWDLGVEHIFQALIENTALESLLLPDFDISNIGFNRLLDVLKKNTTLRELGVSEIRWIVGNPLRLCFVKIKHWNI